MKEPSCAALSATPSTSNPMRVSVSAIASRGAAVSRWSFSQDRVNFIRRTRRAPPSGPVSAGPKAAPARSRAPRRRPAAASYLDRHGVAAPDHAVGDEGVGPDEREDEIARQAGERQAPGQEPAHPAREGEFRPVPEEEHRHDRRERVPPGRERGVSPGRERHGRAGEDLGREEQGKGDAAQPRPAELPVDDLARLARPEGLLEGGVHEMDVQARGAHQLRRRRVLGDLGRERPDAAARVEEGLLPEHALALGEAEAEGLARRTASAPGAC